MPNYCRRTANALLTAIALTATSQAAITLDGSNLGPGGALNGPNYLITPGLPNIRGNNLFYSFGQFNLAQSESATFSSPANIQNILSRVTGGSPSTIDGTIHSFIQGGTTLSGANLFFINPKGVLFSSHAQIDIGGSFVVTTADYIKLADGNRFVATNPTSGDDALLSAAAPIAFGFLGSNPGSISVAGGTLSVPNDQSFSIVGGDITVDGGVIQAPGGRVNLVSLKSPGELALDVTDFSALPDASTFSQQGQINLQNSAAIDASGAGGGQIVIRGGQLTVTKSLVVANTTGNLDGKGIDVVADDIQLNGQGVQSGIQADTVGGSGSGGDITVVANTVDIRNGARISTATGGTGNGGDINLTANAITLDGNGVGFPFTGIAVSSETFSSSGGDAGHITIVPRGSGGLALQVFNGALISARTLGGGKGGSIDVTASDILLDADTTGTLPFILETGITAETFGSGAGGNIGIDVQTGSLCLIHGSDITARTEGTGAGGNVDIINADSVTVQSSSRISAETIGLSDGGTIHIEANTVSLEGPGATAIFAGDEFGFGSGFHGGDISILANQVDVINGAQISSSVVGGTIGGSVTLGPLLNGQLTLTLANRGQITTSTDGSSGAGDITINTDRLTILGDSTINNADPTEVLRQTQITSSSSSSGNGGKIDIHAAAVLLRNGGRIAVSTTEPATLAGDITIDAQSDIQLLGGSEISAQAGPVNDPINEGQNGGNITLTAGKLIYLRDSKLTAQAVNNGGNITIDPQFVVLNNGRITADAIFGTGGQLNITSGFLFLSPGPLDQMITADSRFGTDGEVVIDAVVIDLSGALLPLSASLLGAEQQLPPYCGVRLGGVSTFLVLGRGGLPLEPVGWLPSFAMDNAGGSQ